MVEQFFVQERKKHRRMVVLLWITAGIGDLFAIVAWLEGVEISRILRGLVVLGGFVFVMMWLSLHQKKTLQDRLGALLASIEFGWDEFHGLDLNSAEADHLHIAFAATGRVAEAETEEQVFLEACARVPESRLLHNNRVVDLLEIAKEMVRGEVEYRKANHDAAFDHLRRSVALEDALPFDEPWGWSVTPGVTIKLPSGDVLTAERLTTAFELVS